MSKINSEMIGNTGFNASVDIFHRALDVQTLRQSVIANNIANSDTPNFKRTEVNFEESLKRALQGKNNSDLAAARTHPNHVSFDQSITYQDVRPRLHLDYATTGKNNNNNVDIEYESNALLQSRLSYSLYTNTIDRMFDRTRSVLN